MTLRKLLEFRIFGVDGFHIEAIFSSIRELINDKGTATRKSLASKIKMEADKRDGALDKLVDCGFINIDSNGIITILKEIDYSKNKQCDD